MPRIRTIKPEFFVSETLSECSCRTKLLFIGLWVFADDAGNHPAKLGQLRAEVFPYDDVTIDEMRECMSFLIRSQLVVEYAGDDGATYWHVNGWHHQSISNPSKPKWPKFSKDSRSTTVGLHEHSSSTTVSLLGKGKGKGNKDKVARKRATSARATSSGPSFDAFWSEYPKRNGRRLGRKQAKQQWDKIPPENRSLVLGACVRYAEFCRTTDRPPKDAFRFLRDELWAEFTEDVATNQDEIDELNHVLSMAKSEVPTDAG